MNQTTLKPNHPIRGDGVQLITYDHGMPGRAEVIVKDKEMKEQNEILTLADFMGIMLSRHPNHEHDGKWWYRVNEPHEWDIWQPDQDLNQAFSVVREIRKRTGWGFTNRLPDETRKGIYDAWFYQVGDHGYKIVTGLKHEAGKTENEAILTACIQSIKQIENETR